jgi:hypothetical protein
MANGEKPRRHNASFQNANSIQQYENSLENLMLQIGVNKLQTDLVNDQRSDDYNFQNLVSNFQMEEALRAYNHSANIYGLNQKAVDMEVAYQTNQIYSNADARLQELAYAQQDLDFQFAEDSINSSFQAANNSLMLKINEEQTRSRGRQFGADMKAQSIEQTAAKAEGRRNLLKQSLETQQQVGQAAASGRRGQSARLMKQSIESVAAIDHYSLYSQLERGEGSFKNVTSNLADQKKSADYIAERERDKVLNDKDKIAQLFGLTVQQFEADTEKLGRMMIDTYAGIDSQLDRLAQQEFQTRIDLFAKMPLPPRMPPRAKPPREIPYDKYTLPSRPIMMDHKVMGSAPEQPKQSGFGQFLGIAGTIAAGVGTVLTAGAAAPAFAGSAAAMGAWGAGLSAGGSILGGLGSSPMMYNN